MAVSTEQREVSYTGNNSTDSFAVPFPFQDSDQLVVSYTPDGGNETTWVEGVDYTVTGGDGSTGTVVATTAPATDSTLLIVRTVAYLQERNLRVAGTFSARTHEWAFDLLTYMVQQLEDRLTALEALADLVPTTTYQGLQLEKTFTTDASAVEDSFPVNVAMPAGTVAYGARIIRVEATADPTAQFVEAVDCPGWSQTGDNLVLNYVSGLEVNTEYRLTIEVLEEV